MFISRFLFSAIVFISFFCFIKSFLHFQHRRIITKPSIFRSSVIDENIVNEDNVIILTDKAKSHLLSLKKSDDGNLYIRMGVKSGGCSGMSYVMDIIKPEEVTEEDHIEMYDDVKCVVDPKSLLFIYGLKLGYHKIFLNNTYNL
jgi:iron-sulfur cluster assembly protein